MEEIREFNAQASNLREMSKDTQIMIRTDMHFHKKFSSEMTKKIKKNKYSVFYYLNMFLFKKTLHKRIFIFIQLFILFYFIFLSNLNYRKTIELYKEKISKLLQEKEKLESKVSNKFEDDKSDTFETQQMKNQIIREIAEKKELDEKIKEIREDFLIIKNNMGGLNATQQVQEKYEKHIKILENRLDKANQKFNESIEHDKNLRDEIDKLRKERFFFENIYKKLEKDLGKLKYQITDNLQSAYNNYECKFFEFFKFEERFKLIM